MIYRILHPSMRAGIGLLIAAFGLAGVAPNLAHAQADAGPDAFYQDFRLHAELLPPLSFFGPDSAKVTRWEKDGLRIIFPPKRKVPDRVGVQWKGRIKGDFEVIARFAILQAKPPTEGHGVGVELVVATDSLSKEDLGVSRVARVNEGEVYLTSRATTENGKRKYFLHTTPAESKSGRLKITRIGAEAILWAADEDANDFQELRREELGVEDVTLVRLAAYPGHAQNELDIRLLELRARSLTPKQAAAVPVPIEIRAKEPGGMRWLPAVLALGVLTMIGLLVGWLLLRRANQAEVSADEDETPAQSLLTCPGCAKKLKINTSAAGKKLRCPACGMAVRAPAGKTDFEPH